MKQSAKKRDLEVEGKYSILLKKVEIEHAFTIQMI